MKLTHRHSGWMTWLVVLLALVVGGAGIAQERQEKEEVKSEAKKEKKKEGLPLKPERTIEFTTDEGTWLSLDVSPDGKTIIFELLGDLYMLPIEGGEARRLTSGMAFDSQPRYSPDGKLIAFVSDRDGAENLWIANADGSEPKKLSKDKQARFVSPTWTSDGEYVIVSRRTWLTGAYRLWIYELWMYDIRGGSGVQITKAQPQPNTPWYQQHNALGAVASPDGRYLYYARWVRGFFGRALYNFPFWQIARRDRTTGDEDIITGAPGSALRPLLSPDGTKLVYGTRYEAETGLRIRDLTTGEDRWLKYPVQRDNQETRATRDLLPGYAFTPDGKEIVVSYGGRIHRVNVETGEARVIPFTAKVSQEMGPRLNFPARVDDGPVRVRVIQAPVQSPDGKWLAFSALTHLYVMDLPGGTPRRVTSADAREFQPAWSPDGNWLAYVTWSTEGGHIWKVRLPRAESRGADESRGFGTPQRLTRVPAFYRDPVWSPDGSRIVALRAPRQARVEQLYRFDPLPGLDLIWISAEGGEANLVVPARGSGRPHFTNENDRVFVYSHPREAGRSGSRRSQGLISLRYDGTDRRIHVRVVRKSVTGPEPRSAQDVRIAPDGTKALALVRNQLYLVGVPRVGGEPPTVNVDSASVQVKKLTDMGADYFAWADGGQTITWALGSTFFRQPVATVSFEPEKKAEEEAEGEEAKEAEEKKPLVEEIEVVIERPRHRPKGTIVLRGAQVITMRGDEVIRNADIVVTDNRIASVGRRGSVTIPAGAKIFDVRGTTIIPGFVDIHAHWFELRHGVLDMQNWNFLANLAYGVTTARSPSTQTTDIFAYQDLVDVGEMLGPRAFSTGPAVRLWNTDLQSAEDAFNVVAKYTKHYRTNTLKSYTVGNRRQRQWMVQACKKHQIMPTTEGAFDLKLNLTHVIDGFSGNEHSFPIVPLYKDVVELVAKSGLTYTPTLLISYGGPWAENYFYQTTEVHDDPKLRRFIPHNILDRRTKRRMWFRQEEHVYPQLAAAAAKIIRAGGRVGIGGHGQLQGIQVHWEMWLLHSGGLSNLETLRAATLHGAQAIGYAQDLGSIEVGKLADLIVLAKDPLQDIRNTNTIRYVMKNGELFEGNTLNQVWPEQKPLAPLWWWDDKP